MLAFAFIVALAGLWTLPPLDRDEARFAQATAQMLESGDFVQIRFLDEERNKKPAGIHWLQAASVSSLSDPARREIWAYRVPSVLAALLAALLVWRLGAQLYDRPTGLLAALMFSTAPLLAAEATLAKTDAALLAAILAGQAILWRHVSAPQPPAAGWSIGFWVVLGVGVLLKGPIAPMVMALTALVFAVMTGRWRRLLGLRPIIGAVILALLVAPWLYAVQSATEGRFLAEAVGRDMWSKVGSGQESHGAPPGYHLVLLPVLFWPTAALLPAGALFLWRKRRTEAAAFLVAWLVPSWLVFEFSSTKLPHYVLPLYPAIAIASARAAILIERRVRRVGAVLYGLVGLGAAAALAVIPASLGMANDFGAGWPAAVVVAAVSLAIALAFSAGRTIAASFAAAGLAAIYAWLAMGWLLPAAPPVTFSANLSQKIDEAGLHPLHDGAGTVALAGYNEPSLVFLLGGDVTITTGGDAARRLADARVASAYIERDEIDAFRRAYAHIADTPPTPVATIEGLNYSNGDPVSLTLFIADGR